MKHQKFYLTALGAAFLTAALISDVPDCIGAPPPPGNHSRPSGAPPRPSGSTSRPVSAPPRHTSAPPRPSGSTSRPVSAPPKHTSVPPRPSGSTSRPVSAPPRHTSAPPRPSGSTSRPVSAPPKHTSAPPRPSGSTSRPVSAPPRHTSAPPRPSGSTSRPVSAPPRHTSAPPRPAGHSGPDIRHDRFGETSPIHRTYLPGHYDRPGMGPGPGRVPGHNPPPPPPPRPYYPYYSSTYYPPLPAYPPPPPGFPPPPAFWPGFIYNGLPLFINATVNVIPNYPNIQQLGLFAVYDSSGNRCGSLLVYYNPQNSKLGGYFNPSGTKYTRSIQGLVSMVNGVQTAMFTVNDQYNTQCAVPFSALLAGTSASGVMLIPSQISGVEPEASAFSLQRL